METETPGEIEEIIYSESGSRRRRVNFTSYVECIEKLWDDLKEGDIYAIKIDQEFHFYKVNKSGYALHFKIEAAINPNSETLQLCKFIRTRKPEELLSNPNYDKYTISVLSKNVIYYSLWHLDNIKPAQR
jgi:hypothetical protein